MSDATLLGPHGRPGVRLERVLEDPPATVWAALTEPAQLQRWFPCRVEVDGGTWRVGAAMRFVFPPDVHDVTLDGEVLELDVPHRLVYRWGDEVLRFELSAHGTGTRLVLVDELAAPRAARNAAGWEVCLARLEGSTAPAWQARFDAYTAAFGPVLGPQEGPPPGHAAP